MASSSKHTLSPESFDDYNTKLQGAALKAIKTSVVSLPADLGFHRSVNPDYARELDACSARVLSITNRLLSLAASADASQSGHAKGKARLESQDDVVDNFHSFVVDAMDQMLERADTSLDHFLGRSKAPAIAVDPRPAAAKPKPPAAHRGRLDPALQHASHLPKPQLQFRTPADNQSTAPWQPTLRHKYNAQVPLGYVFREETADGADANALATTHPYAHEMRNIQYPPRMFTFAPPRLHKSFADTPFTWVATPAAFAEMLDALRRAGEIAVDLEHHDYRSFVGFVCLMQISTREQDWVVDTLALREELEELNEVFTDPKIVKVFHGAESDVVWLQRDFNLYLVNLFDTYHASRVLGFARHGLANLLETYCDVTPDKRYQLADWRIRPLPQEMLDYARSDTHYLLYVYDNLRNTLLERGARQTPPPDADAVVDPAALVKEVLARSAITALRTHERDVFDVRGAGPGGWDTLARKWNKGAFTAGPPLGPVGEMQRAVYRAVHAWRDAVARSEDESTRYVLPNHYMFQLAETPPADMAALLHVFHPVPPVIRRRAKELLDAVRNAVKETLGAAGTGGKATDVVAEVPEADMTTQVVEDPQPGKAQLQIGAAPLSTSQLWSNSSSRLVLAAVSSSLLGTLSKPLNSAGGPSIAYSAPKSALFGGPSRATNGVASTSFRDVIARIHSSLVIAPTLPIVAVTTDMPPSTIADADENPGTSVSAADIVPAELAFVPASQRSAPSTLANVVDDAIVVVGQRQKKRKRDRAPKASTSGASTPATGIETPEVEVEPFDYASAPNLLDAGAGDAPGGTFRAKKKKLKHAKGGVLQYGDFPAPPRAYSEVKSGNQSHTFR